MRLAERYSLVKLEMHKFGDRVTRDDLGMDINDHHGVTDPKAVKVTVDVLGSAEVKELRNIQNKARAAFNEEAKYLFDKPWRIVPNERIDNCEAIASQCASDCEEQVELIVEKLPEHIERKERELGQLFRLSDYPTADVIRSKVSVHYDVRPLPEADHDPRLGLSPEQVERQRLRVIEAERRRIHSIEVTMKRDLYQMLTHLVERLKGYTGKKEGSYNNTLFTNIEDYIERMPEFNLGENKELDELRSDLVDLLRVNPDTTRVDPGIRKAVAEAGQDMIDRLGHIGA